MSDRQMEGRSIKFGVRGMLELSGTAVVPDGGGIAPGVLLLSGSGPLDRDSNTPRQRLNVSSTLANALALVGIASLRFDKRGVGASAGDYPSTGFDCETSDAAAALDTMRSIDGIDPGRIGVVGHSAGATIAARLGAHSESVAFAVLLSCAASSGADVMAWQTERIAEGLPGPSWALERWFRRKQTRLFDRLDASIDDTLGTGKHAIPAKWMREYRVHDPIADLAALRCPVLAITGGKDIQVDPEETSLIREVVPGLCTTLIPSNLTHVLRTSAHRPSVTRYEALLKKPVDDDLVQTVITWILDLATEAPGAGDHDGPQRR